MRGRGDGYRIVEVGDDPLDAGREPVAVGLRTMARTGVPRRARASATARPVLPVAPVTRTGLAGCIMILPPGGHLPDAQLLEEQQAVRVGPVLGEHAVGDAQGIGAGEADLAANRLG